MILKEVSVIVVTYNQEETIGRTLDSILRQKTDFPFEIVIGDDYSADATDEICRRYEREYPDRIRYFRRLQNLGVVENYFRCIADSRGRFLADCAGDDFWVDERKLQKEYDIMAADPEVALVHTDWRYCDSDGSNVREAQELKGTGRNRLREFGKGELTIPFLRRDPVANIHLCTAMFRKSMLEEEIRKDSGVFVSPGYTCEDLQIITAMTAAGKIVYLPDVTLHYSVNPVSLTHDFSYSKVYKQEKGYLKQTIALARLYGIEPSVLKEHYKCRRDYMAAQVLHSGDREMREDYRKFIKAYPDLRKRSLKTRIRELLFGNDTLWSRYLK